jgi:hypothetical protein
MIKLRRRLRRFKLGKTREPFDHQMAWATIPNKLIEKTIEGSVKCAQYKAVRTLMVNATHFQVYTEQPPRECYKQPAKDPHTDAARLRFIELTSQAQSALMAVDRAQKNLASAHILSLECRIIKTLAGAEYVISIAKGPIGSALHRRREAARRMPESQPNPEPGSTAAEEQPLPTRQLNPKTTGKIYYYTNEQVHESSSSGPHKDGELLIARVYSI